MKTFTAFTADLLGLTRSQSCGCRYRKIAAPYGLTVWERIERCPEHEGES